MKAKALETREVVSPVDWKNFFCLPKKIYVNGYRKAWVPPLISEQIKILDKKKNPFFKHAHYKAWIVMEEDEIAGRVLAYIDDRYNEHYQERTGFFGFFECENNPAVAHLLFKITSAWLREKGMCRMRGPINFDISNECGILMSGFEFMPYLQMNHTPPYYQQLFEEFNFSKSHDLLAYRITRKMILDNEELLPKLKKISDKILNREGIEFRNINMKKYNEELENINNLYNSFMDKNWGFVPATMEDMLYSAKSLKQIVNPKMIFFAGMKDKTVGCSISIPDINQALTHMNGRLFPFGIFKFLYYKPKINRIRLILLGIDQSFRLRGMDILFYYYTMQRAFENGYDEAELSWISEDNNILISIVEKLGAELYKKYRVYEKPL
jgi:hypothetical protein